MSTLEPALPDEIVAGMEMFVESAKRILGGDLESIVLFGTAAEGRLRATSDVNLVLVLTSFDPTTMSGLRQPLAAAQAAIRLNAMFVLDSELSCAMECFGEKFSDIVRRHRVLFGPDPFTGAPVSRQAVIWRFKQVLLNLTLRLRAAYVEQGAAAEKICRAIAESAGPLRSCAATLRELQSQPMLAPKEALQAFVELLMIENDSAAVAHISEARERHLLSASAADDTLLRMMKWASAMREQAERLE